MLHPPFTVSRFRLPGRALIETQDYESFDAAMDEAHLIAFGGLTIEITVTDSAGTELFKRVSSNA